MKKAAISLLCLLTALCVFCSCSKKTEIKDVLRTAQAVLINGTESDTVEARMGAFQGKQGDKIEFIFDEPHKVNTVYIAEKTATVRQFNIYARVDGKYMLVYTDKLITGQNLQFETVTADALQVEILNTELGNDHFIIQGVSAYEFTEEVK